MITKPGNFDSNKCSGLKEINIMSKRKEEAHFPLNVLTFFEKVTKILQYLLIDISA
jgi:hypothetical protein